METYSYIGRKSYEEVKDIVNHGYFVYGSEELFDHLSPGYSFDVYRVGNMVAIDIPDGWRLCELKLWGQVI